MVTSAWGGDDAAQGVAAADAQHRQSVRYHGGVAAHLDHRVDAVGRRQLAHRGHHVRRVAAGNVDHDIRAEPAGRREAVSHAVEADHAPGAAGLGDRARVQPQQAQPLDCHHVAHRDPRRLGDRDHGGDAAVDRGRLFVAQLLR